MAFVAACSRRWVPSGMAPLSRPRTNGPTRGGSRAARRSATRSSMRLTGLSHGDSAPARRCGLTAPARLSSATSPSGVGSHPHTCPRRRLACWLRSATGDVDAAAVRSRERPEARPAAAHLNHPAGAPRGSAAAARLR
eukprot:951042-Prymnesium_polylepis.1